MFDHVGIAVSDLAASERFYRTVLSVLAVEPSHADAELVEWEDWAMGPTDREHPVTRGLHVGFLGPRPRAGRRLLAGGRRRGVSRRRAGPRTRYGRYYYGGFLLDPDGNSVEAVHGDREDAVPDGWVDHLLDPRPRPASLPALLHDDRPARRAPPGARRARPRAAVRPGLQLLLLVRDERPLTEHVHLAFPAGDDATVRAFHAAALAAGDQVSARRASAPSTTPATTARSCSTRTGTTSRSSTTTGPSHVE